MNLNAVASALPRAGTPLPPAGADAAASGGSAFAALLDREQGAPAESTDTPAEAADPARTEPTAAQRAARAAKAPARAAERAATKATGETQAERPAQPPKASETDARAEPAQEEAPAADPALLHWLQGLNLPPAAAPAEAGAALPRGLHPAAADAAADAPDAATSAKPSARALGLGGAARGAAAERADADALRGARTIDADAALRSDTPAIPAAAATEIAAAAPRFQDTLAALRTGAAEASGATAPTSATPAAVAAEAAATATVPVPLDDPQFPRAFGVQVSVLAREGVQRAELHLNPAEMGPVSVQIVMDGTQARIDFGADAAPTRALIEHSLPELAAALREAGLTLAGGGVSQHAGQGRDAAPHAPTRGGAPHAETLGEAAATEARPLRRRVAAGGVDLYA